MKKLFFYAAGIGLVAGVICWLCKKEKINSATTNPNDSDVNIDHAAYKEITSYDSNVIEEMYQAKTESANSVYERHSEAGAIMKDAYSNIMEDFVDDFSGENTMNDKCEDAVIDSKDVSVINELDSISDELDNLLN